VVRLLFVFLALLLCQIVLEQFLAQHRLMQIVPIVWEDFILWMEVEALLTSVLHVPPCQTALGQLLVPPPLILVVRPAILVIGRMVLVLPMFAQFVLQSLIVSLL